MYIPKHFDNGDRAAIAELIRAHSFATLVTSIDGVPFATHCPLLFDADAGPQGTLYGHVARANPHWQHFADGHPTLAIFHGPHAYVSPSWYAQQPSVPTWNYVAVHAYGTPRPLQGTAAHDLLARLVAIYEAPDSGWAMDALTDSYMDGMLRGIAAFELPIDRLEAKSKLSQNRSADDRKRVIARLQALGGDDNHATAVAMQAALDKAGT